jgi:carboxypeptidase PM20D1
LLAAHFDVVPANRVNDNWSFEPFKGVINEGFIYGRGALDDKASMLSQLEALKVLLRRQGQPKRTLYLAYGHDEESAGHEGAGKIADFINEPLEYVLDEGTMIIEDLFPELNRPVAYISIAEKGYLTLKFSVNTTGGHSSMPKFKDSAIYILSQAINKLETQRVPSMFGLGPEKSILEKLSVHFGFIKRILFSNIWLFKPVLE